jgi:hypothetical protein
MSEASYVEAAASFVFAIAWGKVWAKNDENSGANKNRIIALVTDTEN